MTLGPRLWICFTAVFLAVSLAFAVLALSWADRRAPAGSDPSFVGGSGNIRAGRDVGAPGVGRETRRLTAAVGAYVAIMATVFAAASAWQAYLIGCPLRMLNEQLEQAPGRDSGLQVDIDDPNPEFRRLQGNVNNQLARARLALLQLNRYAGQVAHELRTPLTVMRLKVEQAADKIEPRLAEELQGELLRLTMHVEQSLLVARAEQGHLALNAVRFDLGALLDEAVEDFRLMAQEQGRTVVYLPAQAQVTADPKYTKQILYNLLNNALRHGSGPVRIRLVERTQQSSVLIGNRFGAPVTDPFNLALGKRIVASLVGLHGNMTLRTRSWGDWFFVRLVIAQRDSDV